MRFPEVIDVKLPNIRKGSMHKDIHKTQSNSELAVENTPFKVPQFDRANSKNADVTDSQRESCPGKIKQQVSIMSDRTSENDSKSSGSVVVTKKTTKNNAQKTTKPLRSKKLLFDHLSNPDLVKWFDKVAPDKPPRIKNMHTFRSYLEKRYQYPIANQIATILAPRFQNGFQNTVLIADYYKTIEKFAN